MNKRTAKKSSGSWKGFILCICLGIGMIGFTVCYSLYPLFDYYGWDEVKMSLQVSQCKKKTHYGGYKGVTHTMETCHINYTYTYRGESHSGSMTGERPSSGKVKAYINPKAPGAPKIYKPVIPLVCVFSFISILCFILAICFRPGSKDENINRPPRR